MSADQALYFFIDESIIPMTPTMNEIGTRYAEKDGVVYVTYSVENAFG